MVSFRFKRPCMPPVVITQRRLTLPARSDRSGAAFRNRWGTVSKEVGHRYDREPKSAPLPVETAPHFVRNCAPLPVGISAPFRPESARCVFRSVPHNWLLPAPTNRHTSSSCDRTALGGSPGDVLEGASVPLGTGLVDIPAALRAARETGVRHYYIEDEAVDAAQQLSESLRYLESVRL